MKRRRGLTMLEVVIASSILVVIALAAFSILHSSASIANTSSIQSGLEARGRELLAFCRSSFYVARFRDPQNLQTLGVYDDNTQVRFQVPVARDASGAMPYGYTAFIGKDDPAMAGSSFCVLRFEANTVLRESAAALPAAVAQVASTPTVPPLPALPALQTLLVGLDVNRNGRLDEVFVSGKLMKYVIGPDPAGGGLPKVLSSETLDDQVILRVDAAGHFNGAVDPKAGTPVSPADSDGVYRGDSLIRYVDGSGNTVLGPFPGTQSIGVAVSVWHGTLDENGKSFLIRPCKETIRFRNTQ